jgi:hypothetical protein
MFGLPDTTYIERPHPAVGLEVVAAPRLYTATNADSAA